MKNTIKKVGLAMMAVVTAASLASCSDVIDKKVEVTTAGTTGTKEVRFKIVNPPKGFVTASATAKNPTTLWYSAVSVRDENGKKIPGDVTTYCKLYYIDGKGVRQEAQAMAANGKTHQNGDGYVMVTGCSQTVFVNVGVNFSINSDGYYGSTKVPVKVLKS